MGAWEGASVPSQAGLVAKGLVALPESHQPTLFLRRKVRAMINHKPTVLITYVCSNGHQFSVNLKINGIPKECPICKDSKIELAVRTRTEVVIK